MKEAPLLDRWKKWIFDGGVVRPFLLIWIGMSLVTSVVIIPSWWVWIQSQTQVMLAREQSIVSGAAGVAAKDFSGVISDLRLLGQSKSLRQWLESGSSQAFDDFRQELLAFHFEKRMYDQVRLLDFEGKEQIRFQLRNGNPVPVLGKELQDKSETTYVKETKQLKPWDVFISPLDLNREHGKVERPFKPVIRLSMLLADRNSKPGGSLVLNYYGGRIVRELSARLQTSIGDGMVINDRGYWIHSPSPEVEWGFALPHNLSFRESYPEVWAKLSKETKGSVFLDGHWYVFDTAYPLAQAADMFKNSQSLEWAQSNAQRYQWKMVTALRPAVTPAFASPLAINVYLVCLSVIALLSFFLARAQHAQHLGFRALTQSEEHFRNLIEGSLQSILIRRGDKPVFVNDTFVKLFRYDSQQEVLAKASVMDFIAPGERERIKLYVDKRQEGKPAPTSYEYKGLCKDGTEIWLENFTQEVNWQGKPAVQIVALDITLRKEAEARLVNFNRELELQVEKRTELLSRANEEATVLQHQLSASLDAIGDGFALFDEEERLVLYNPRLVEIYPNLRDVLKVGITYEEIIRDGVNKGEYPEALGREEEYIWERVAQHKDPEESTQHLSNGLVIEVRDYRTASGGYVSTRRDITDMVKAEQAVAESEGRFRDFAESSADWFWEMDENLVFTYVSPKIEEILGVSPEVFLNKRREEIYLSEEQKKVWEEHKKILLAHQPFKNYEVYREFEGGINAWISTSGVPAFNDAGAFVGYRGTSQDITKRKKAEDELQKYREDLERLVVERTQQVQKTNEKLLQEVRERKVAETRALEANQAKSVFLANMSHELRTPLNAIIGYSELVAEEMEDVGNQDYVEDLTKIRSAGQHLLGMINEILDLSKIEAGQMEVNVSRFDLAKLVDETASTVLPLVGKRGNKLVVKNNVEGVFMESDAGKVRQILLNLLSNAAKFTEKGTITLSAAPTKHSAEFVLLSVKDTGAGISETDQPMVFGEFTQVGSSVDRKNEGTGLGLAITKRLCGMLGGDILLMSQLGKGSEFSVQVPVRVEVEEASESIA